MKIVVKDAMDVLETFSAVIRSTVETVSNVDVLQSLAYSAQTSPTDYCLPELTDVASGDTVIIGGRHPLVERCCSDCYIPNDYKLTHESGRFSIITGPNMGGKSTYIRGIGCIVVLAQIGAYVPAVTATINVFDNILCRVGAGDLQNDGVSTFMAEMMEAKDIINVATDRSLVIIDELGRGTSTMDGYGLAWAISEYICKSIKCTTLFATHFHEVTKLSQVIDCVRNLHVTAEVNKDGKLTFLYDVREGCAKESFGIKVADMARVPQKVIEAALVKANELECFGAKRKRDDGVTGDAVISMIKAIDEKESDAFLMKRVKEILG